MRVLFLNKGDQRKFLKKVLENTNCPSLRALKQFGFDINYSTMKNYFSGERLMNKELFEDLCHISKLNPLDFKIEYVSDYWGQVKGGKKSRRRAYSKRV